MLSKKHLREFIDAMSLAMRQGGYVAKVFQGRVLNEGKAAESLVGDSAELSVRRAAKTAVDDVVQEILLRAAANTPVLSSARLDVEENTPSVQQFSQSARDMTLVIDPVDGTMEYISGLSSYSICTGLIEQERMVSALVYFPARDVLYFLDQTGKAVVATDAYASGLKKAEPMPISQATEPSMYKNSRVSDAIVECIRSCGYKVLDDTDNRIGCSDAILKCISGRSIAYISHTRQTRDILLGAIISHATGGYAIDWTGRPLKWPQQGHRVPRAVFGVGEVPAALLNCLAIDS